MIQRITTAVCSLALAAGSLFALPEKPNIIFYFTDDQDLHEMGFTGGDVLTPHLDRMAENGVVFYGNHMTSTVCAPSRYSMFTGRHASRFDHWDRDWLDYNHRYILFGVQATAGETSVATILKDAGYVTGMVGKVDGFMSTGLPKSLRNALRENTFRFDDPEQAKALRDAHRKQSDSLKEQIGFDYAEGLTAGNYGDWGADGLYNNTDWMTLRAAEFIKKAHAAGKPFYLWASPPTLHTLKPKENFAMDRRKTFEGLLDETPTIQPSPEDVMRRIKEAGLPEESAIVTWQDDSLGALIRTVEELGIAEDTLIIFASDHGGGGGKSSPYNIGTAIPMVFYWAGQTEGQPDNRQVVSSIDAVATMLDLAGATNPAGNHIDGISLRSALQGDPIDERPVLIESGNMRAVVKDDWKFISFRFPEQTLQQLPADYQHERVHLFHPGVKNHNLNFMPMLSGAIRQHPAYYYAEQLYNIDADPAEKNNLAQDPAYADKLAEMKRAMADVLKPLPGSFGDFKFDVILDGAAIHQPLHLEGDLDLSAPFNIVSINEKSTPNKESYTIITYGGSRIGEFDDTSLVEAKGYRVDYSQPGKVRLVKD